MAHLKSEIDNQLLEEFIKDLDATTSQVQSLLNDVRESEVEFATIKTELRIFVEHVKELSSIIREGDKGSSLLTRIALVEKSIEEIETWIKIVNQKQLTPASPSSQHSLQLADKTGKWQLVTAITAGILAFITSTITLLINLLTKH